MESNRPAIKIKGVRTNNLKNISLEIPRGKITALVGISGAGKTSLAFNTIYAEGYLRYIESISPFIRQFLEKMEKPDVEEIEGLPPAISFRHKKPAKNPRSIVATSLDIFDYLKILYSKIGDFFCPACHQPVVKYTIDEIVHDLFRKKVEKIDICFEYKGDIPTLVNRGYYYHFKNGRREKIDASVSGKSILVWIDGIQLNDRNRGRIFEGIDKALSLGDERVMIFSGEKSLAYTTLLYCTNCRIQYLPPDENLFSFNSPRGACPQCNGFGDVQQLDRNAIFDWDRSMESGGIRPLSTPSTRGYLYQVLDHAGAAGIPADKPLGELPREHIDFLMDGNSNFEGLTGFFNHIRKKSYKVQVRVFLSRYTAYSTCPACSGSRFNRQALAFKIKNKSIGDFLSFSIGEALHFIQNLDEGMYAHRISPDVFEEIKTRLTYLKDIGLSYITLNRHSFTLSRGEYQRINLAFILGSTLSDSLLIIDQPSSDLHPHDYLKLKRFLRSLRDSGNTILIIEHNRDVVKFADYVLELGPYSGQKGGEIEYFGPVKDFFSGKETITQKHFNRIRKPVVTSVNNRGWIQFKRASAHNLKKFDFKIPRGAFTVVVGVSGAGKTSLLYNEIFLQKRSIEGFKEVMFIDPGINQVRPNMIVGGFFEVFSSIRDMFAQLKESQLNQFKPGHFSFNSPLGRCDYCSGKGYVEVEMQFLPSMKVGCHHCGRKGYKPDVLKVRYRDRNIVDVLGMGVEEFIDLAGEDLSPKALSVLENVRDCGLGHLALGQKLTGLSSGELQRIKLAKFLNQQKKNTLFLIDEPSFGLHPYDVQMVLQMLKRILENQNTIVAAEHNLDVISEANYMIELGPGGGDSGGHLVCQGDMNSLIQSCDSITAKYIKKIIKKT